VPNYIFHIGLPKTASTSLQHAFGSVDCHSVIYNPLEIERKIDLYFYYYVFKGTFAQREEVIDHHGWDLDRTIARINRVFHNKTVLISTESLTYIPNRLCHHETVKFLSRYFGDNPIKIILLLRNQPEWMMSYYKHMVTFHALTDDFCDFFREGPTRLPNVPSELLSGSLIDEYSNFKEWKFSQDSLNYADMIKTFETYFGKSNILVYTFEQLIRQRNDFSKKVSQLFAESSFELRIDKLPHKLASESALTVKLMRSYFKLFKHINVRVTSEPSNRCELDKFAMDLTFPDALKATPRKLYPKLIVSRLYRRRLIFCNARSIRHFCRFIGYFLPSTKFISSTNSVCSKVTLKNQRTYWSARNKFIMNYVDSPDIQRIYDTKEPMH
jgi:hypothetical protein